MEIILKDLHTLQQGHIYYQYHDENIYMQHLISFIQTGIDNNNRILVIENMRNLPKIKEKIETMFTEEQQSYILFVNNFQYYLANGDFNTRNIISNFKNDLTALKHPSSSIRSWANVEWASTRPKSELLEEFEAAADELINNENLLSVCAYSSVRLNEDLNNVLLKVHEFAMTDDSFALSTLYNILEKDK